MTPSRNARTDGLSTRSLDVWLMMSNTLTSGWPFASALVQPVSDSATEFRKVTRPATSVVITASPMLASVTRHHSGCDGCRPSFVSAMPFISITRPLSHGVGPSQANARLQPNAEDIQVRCSDADLDGVHSRSPER